MPTNLTCVCGNSYRIPDHLKDIRIICQKCGRTLEAQKPDQGEKSPMSWPPLPQEFSEPKKAAILAYSRALKRLGQDPTQESALMEMSQDLATSIESVQTIVFAEIASSTSRKKAIKFTVFGGALVAAAILAPMVLFLFSGTRTKAPGAQTGAEAEPAAGKRAKSKKGVLRKTVKAPAKGLQQPTQAADFVISAEPAELSFTIREGIKETQEKEVTLTLKAADDSTKIRRVYWRLKTRELPTWLRIPGVSGSLATGRPSSLTVHLAIDGTQAPGEYKTELVLGSRISSYSRSRSYSRGQVHLRAPTVADYTLPITLTVTADERIYRLPSRITDLAVGGKGRYVVLYLQALRKLAVFDLRQRKILKYVTVPYDEILFTAGVDKLFVAGIRERRIHRYDLTTLKEEASADLPLAEKLRGLVTNFSDNGPLLVASGKEMQWTFLNRQDFTVIPTTWKTPLYRSSSRSKGTSVLSAWTSASHMSFVFYDPETKRAHCVVKEGSDAYSHFHGPANNYARPGAAGAYIFSSRGIYSNQLIRVKGFPSDAYYFPALSGLFYLSLPTAELRNRKPTLSLRHVESRPSLGSITIDQQLRVTTGPLSMGKRILFVPEEKLLVVVPDGNDRLFIQEFDVEAALKTSSQEYFFVSSLPPYSVKDDRYEYAIQVKSKKGGVTYSLESGPPGMKLTPDGKLVWQIPKKAEREVETVIVKIRDASGKELFHVLKIPHGGEDGETPATAKGDKARESTGPREGEFTEVKLPGLVADVAVGAAGKFLLLHLAQLNKFAVFDLEKRAISRYISAPKGKILFAAGKDTLVVIDPASRKLIRWSLQTFEQVASTSIPVQGVVKAIAMGSGSDGPLLMHWVVGSNATDKAVFALIDINTMQRVVEDFHTHNRIYRDYVHIRAATDGSVFGIWSAGRSPSGMDTVVFRGGEFSTHHERQSVEHVMPGPQGRVVYTARGLFTEEAKPYPTKLFSEGICFIPAHHGHSFLGISGLSRGSKKSKARISVYLLGQDQPLLPLPEIPFVLGRGDLYNRSFSPDKRFHFSPRYDLLVVIPPTNDRLLLTVVDVKKVLQQSGRRYLFVTSIPPVQAVSGSTYKYQIEVQSREKKLSYSLESGPKGLRVSPTGAVAWKVPRSAASGQKTVIIKVRDASGQEIFHTFVINLK